MKVAVTLKQPSQGLLSELIGKDRDAKKLAFKVALAKAARGLEQDIEAGLRGAGLPKLAPLMASAAYPAQEGKGSFNAQAVVYVKAGPQFQAAISLAAEGATLRAHGGRFMAIPIGAHPRAAERSAIGWTPRMMAESRAAFLRRRKNGPGFIWMLRVSDRPLKQGPRSRRSAVVVSAALARRAKGLVGGVGAVPMFLLVPELTVRSRFNVPSMVTSRFAEVERRYDEEFRRITGG